MGINKYRVVKDSYAGFEVQKKRWWFPFWLQVGINTSPTLDIAIKELRFFKNGKKTLYEE